MYGTDKDYDDAIKFFQNAPTDGNGLGTDYATDDEVTRFMKQNANELGNKLMVIFWIDIFSAISNLILNIAQRTNGYVSTSYPIGLLAVDVISIVLSIVYLVMLFSLTKFDDNYKTTAIISIINVVLDIVVAVSLFVFAPLSVILSLIVVVLTYVQEYCFIQALIGSVGIVFTDLANSLQTYWKGLIMIITALIVSLVFLCVPFLNLIVMVVDIGLGIALIAFEIWKLVLLWQCASSMRNYAKYNM